MQIHSRRILSETSPSRHIYPQKTCMPDDIQTTNEILNFQILALDGGGIKGVFSAAFLAAMEEDLGSPIINHFDLIAGTSTGGIIALGLGLGLSPKEILEFYVKNGKDIFSDRSHLRSILQWFHRKFPAEQLETALKAAFGLVPDFETSG